MIMYDIGKLLSLIGMLIGLTHNDTNLLILNGVLVIMWKLKYIEYRLIKENIYE